MFLFMINKTFFSLHIFIKFFFFFSSINYKNKQLFTQKLKKTCNIYLISGGLQKSNWTVLNACPLKKSKNRNNL